jgi:mRNA interferase RelE/StbE
MTIRFTERADKDYAQLPPAVRKVFAKQIDLLLANFRHPSLRAKKYARSEGLWQARVDRRWRFYFKIQDDEYAIVSIIPHPK